LEPPRPSTRLSQSGAGLSYHAAYRRTESQRLLKMLRGELDWIAMKALEKDRNLRYATASALALDVQRYLNDEPVEACPPSLGYRLRKVYRKHRVALLGAGAFAAVLLAATGVSLAFALHAERSKQVALAAEEDAAHDRDNAIKAVEATTAALDNLER